MHTDRQIAVWGGWIAGPAFGVAMMAAPEYLHLKPALAAWFFWGGILVFVVTVFVIAALQRRELERGRKPMWPIIAMAAGVTIFGIGAAGYFWPRPEGLKVAESASKPEAVVAQPLAPPAESGPQSLLDLFKNDFERTLRAHSELTLTASDGSTDKITIQIYNDMDTGTYFIGFYVPISPRTRDIVEYFADGYLGPTLQLRQGVEVTSRDPADTTSLKFSEFIFSRRIYAYHETELSIQEIAALDTLYRSKNLILQLRGRQYQTTRWLQKSAIKK